jgi:hypothetical protein
MAEAGRHNYAEQGTLNTGVRLSVTLAIPH